MPTLGKKLARFFAFGLIAAGLAILGVGAFRHFAAPGEAPLRHAIERERYSLLLITVDTTRADRLEPYGATNVATPSLARLAERGIVFERAYAVAPITLVAHTSILTGLDPPRHAVRNNGTHYVPEQLTTLAEHLSDGGYRTAAFVSAAVLERRYNLAQGFEVYDDDLSAGRERHPRMVADRPAEATVAAAAAWLSDLDDDDRFFLWVHLYDPHASYSPPPPYRDQYRERLYDGEIAYMDAQIGELLRHPRLRDRGGAGHGGVVVNVLGDHGESLGEHGEATHALLAYDSTLHIPWILEIPGGPRGLRVGRNVSQVDFVPTVLDLVGLAGTDADGASLVPLLEGHAGALGERGLYAETWLPFYTYGWSKLGVYRRGRYKWIAAPEPELYDTRRDPRELANIAEHQPGLAHDLARDLGERLAAAGDAGEAPTLALDAEAREKLRSLGYLGAGSRPVGASSAPRADPKEMVDVHVGLERARFLIRDRLFRDAAAELREVLRRDPTNLAGMIDLASVLAEQSHLDEAVRIVERALELDPRYTRLHLLLADFEGRRGKAQKALELYDTALELDPRSLEARLQKALHLRRLGRWGEARALLEETLAEHPRSPPLAAVYAQTVELADGDLDAAARRLEAALTRDPFLALGWRLLGEVRERQRRPEDAAEAYRQGLERAIDDPELHARLGLLLARRHAGADAEAHLREALRLARRPRPDVRVALGAWLAERGRFEEAQVLYAKALEENPQNPAARNNRAIAFYQSGRLDDAERALLTLVEHYPRHADAHNNLAAIALDQGRFEDAEKRARRALALHPEMAEAWNNLGLALAAQSRSGDARQAYERALAILPDYWQASLNLGLILGRLGAWADAEEALATVVRRRPHLAQAHLELGHILAGPLDRPEQARTHLNAFLRLAGEDPQAAEVRRRLAELTP